MTWTAGDRETNGISIHYLRTGGSKPPALLLHGLIGSGACWTPVARGLEDEFDVVMPDSRGHGGSSAPERGYLYDDLARDVVGLIGALELDPLILMGHSMGGMTAAVVASRGGRAIRGLVLVDPTFISPAYQREVHEGDVAEQHRRMLSLTKRELVAEARARHPRRSSELLDLMADARLRTSLSAFEVLTPPNPDFRHLVSAIQVPTLLVVGDKGNVVSLETARELQSLNPRLRVGEIRDAGHGLPYDQPERLVAAVRSFVRAIP